jgi:uncharacterized protein
MRMHRWLAVLAGVALTLAVALADDQQAIPVLTARVTDTTGTLDAQQKQSLEDELAALEQRKGSQLAVLIVPTTQPEEIEQYSIRVVDAWKLGRKTTQDGVLLIVAKNDHRVRIEVGRGLEGAIPDAATARIIREYITPKFRAGDFYGGIRDATGALTKLIDGEQLPPPLEGDKASKRNHDDAFNGIIISLFAGFWMRGMFGWLPRFPRGLAIGGVCGFAAFMISGFLYAGIGVGIFGLILGLLGGVGGRFVGSGGWGGFGGGGFGGGSFGGGGGGGFSGGGGGFAGGGASGSW